MTGTSKQLCQSIGTAAMGLLLLSLAGSNAPGRAAEKQPQGSEVKTNSPTVSTGTFRGAVKVKWTGALVRRPPLVVKGDQTVKDSAVCGAADIPDETFLFDEKTQGIAHVFVYLRHAPAGYTPVVPKDLLKVATRGCRFVPHALIVQVGQTVEFDERDAASHTIHLFLNKNTQFGRAIPAGPVFRETFQKPESFPSEMKCDFHPWMRGRLLVLDHPFAAVTDARGEFTIKDLPAGTHEFVVWHERVGYLERKLTVKISAGQTIRRDVQTRAEQFAP